MIVWTCGWRAVMTQTSESLYQLFVVVTGSSFTPWRVGLFFKDHLHTLHHSVQNRTATTQEVKTEFEEKMTKYKWIICQCSSLRYFKIFTQVLSISPSFITKVIFSHCILTFWYFLQHWYQQNNLRYENQATYCMTLFMKHLLFVPFVHVLKQKIHKN